MHEFYALSPCTFSKTASVFYVQRRVNFILLYLTKIALSEDCLAPILLLLHWQACWSRIFVIQLVSCVLLQVAQTYKPLCAIVI